MQSAVEQTEMDLAATKLQARVRGRNARTTKRVAIAGEPARGRRVRTLGKRFDEKLLLCAVVARADGSVDVEATSLGSARESIATVRSEDIAEAAVALGRHGAHRRLHA